MVPQSSGFKNSSRPTPTGKGKYPSDPGPKLAFFHIQLCYVMRKSYRISNENRLSKDHVE